MIQDGNEHTLVHIHCNTHCRRPRHILLLRQAQAGHAIPQGSLDVIALRTVGVAPQTLRVSVQKVSPHTCFAFCCHLAPQTKSCSSPLTRMRKRANVAYYCVCCMISCIWCKSNLNFNLGWGIHVHTLLASSRGDLLSTRTGCAEFAPCLVRTQHGVRCHPQPSTQV